MSKDDYLKATLYCEKIEDALNEIAKSIGHCSMQEFFKDEANRELAGEPCQC